MYVSSLTFREHAEREIHCFVLLLSYALWQSPVCLGRVVPLRMQQLQLPQ